ncbi:MAG: antibiotic biosynthesis monooxygenase [Myxococcaceae bacterium]|nr:antibiotic biosynthesis monooxygenase [Myxococcaceae bacterium]
MTSPLLVVHVQVRVQPQHIEAFRAATLDNAQASRREPGIARFDVVQDRDDPTRFVLVEVYRSEHAPAAHKATAHYERWRECVEPWLAEPRTRRSFDACYPEIEHW